LLVILILLVTSVWHCNGLLYADDPLNCLVTLLVWGTQFLWTMD